MSLSNSPQLDAAGSVSYIRIVNSQTAADSSRQSADPILYRTIPYHPISSLQAHDSMPISISMSVGRRIRGCENQNISAPLFPIAILLRLGNNQTREGLTPTRNPVVIPCSWVLVGITTQPWRVNPETPISSVPRLHAKPRPARDCSQRMRSKSEQRKRRFCSFFL